MPTPSTHHAPLEWLVHIRNYYIILYIYMYDSALVCWLNDLQRFDGQFYFHTLTTMKTSLIWSLLFFYFLKNEVMLMVWCSIIIFFFTIEWRLHSQYARNKRNTSIEDKTAYCFVWVISKQFMLAHSSFILFSSQCLVDYYNPKYIHKCSLSCWLWSLP